MEDCFTWFSTTKKFIILCGCYRFFSSLSFYHGLDMFWATRDALVINGSYPGFFTSSCQPLWTNPSKLNLYSQFLHFPKICDFPAEEKHVWPPHAFHPPLTPIGSWPQKGCRLGFVLIHLKGCEPSQLLWTGFPPSTVKRSASCVLSTTLRQVPVHILSAGHRRFATMNSIITRQFDESNCTIVFVSGRWPSNSTSNLSKNHEISMI